MNVSSTATPVAQIAADLLVLGAADGAVADALAALPGAADLSALAAEEDFTGKAGTGVQWPALGRVAARRIMIVGLGAGSQDEIRRAAGAAGRTARNLGLDTVALALGALGDADAAAAVEGFGAGNYVFDKYKAEDARKAPVHNLLLAQAAGVGDLDRAAAVVGGQNLARDLVNEPADAIYPATLADAAVALAGPKLSVEVWDEQRIAEEGMGGIIAVGQGSDRKPRFVHMIYRPEGAPRRKVALVGKGVTFDAGGYSIKPSAGMQTMRCDMAGSAAVIGTMAALARIQPDVEVHGIVGAAENLISGNAYKLGDVLKMYSGKTVEVHNTDAEGRLVLADCLTYASKLGVDEVVDIATLTGACVVALGEYYTGLFTNDEDVAGSLLDAAASAGEGLWRMPLPSFYKSKLKADWGTIKNVGGREGGAITAALFLSEFVDGPKWAHLDIAGPSFVDRPFRHFTSGGTGAMVPTLTAWVCRD